MDERVRSALLCDITRPIVVIPYRRFGTTRQGSRNTRRVELHSGRAQISSTSGESLKSHKVQYGLQIAVTLELNYYYYYNHHHPVSHPSLLALSSFAGLVNLPFSTGTFSGFNNIIIIIIIIIRQLEPAQYNSDST